MTGTRAARLAAFGLSTAVMAEGAAAPGGDPTLGERLKQHVIRLSRDIGLRDLVHYEQLEEAAVYIERLFIGLGYEVESQRYRHLDQSFRNLIATKPGTRTPQVVIVGAHYDSCFNPGADDNASGVAALLELARLAREEPSGRTVKFIAFTNEEPPLFQTEQMGSRVYARAARARGEEIQAALILEMLGYYDDRRGSQQYPPLFGLFYPSRANFISVVGDFRSGRLCRQVVRAFKRASAFPIESVSTFQSIPGVAWSDHWSFWQEGYPAVMISDTAFLRNPHYHQASDTWETLDYERMAAVVMGLAGVLQELGGTSDG